MIAKYNIFNIRDNKQNFIGSDGSTKGFINFVDVAWCVRAAIMILRNYNRRGIITIERIISTWAPPVENNTDRYITFVCDSLHTSKFTEIDIYKPCQLFQLFQAMARMETGVTLYSADFDLGYRRYFEKNYDIFESLNDYEKD